LYRSYHNTVIDPFRDDEIKAIVLSWKVDIPMSVGQRSSHVQLSEIMTSNRSCALAPATGDGI
jgi:hypothetical protein